jgi:hypothetical protein
MGRNAVHRSTPANNGGVTDERAAAFDHCDQNGLDGAGVRLKKDLFDHIRLPDSKFVLIERITRSRDA